ncbi:MAG: GTP cyclohydrolase II RibA [Variibacter sp.]|nr:GTP cyclohydrolase II RibA [Variibacter sp.]
MASEIQGADLELFGGADEIAVQRGLAEFRAGRPVEVTAGADRVVTLPLDGASATTIAALRASCGRDELRLAVTSRRARRLGLDVTTPVLIELSGQADLASIWSLATQIGGKTPVNYRTASSATVAALELAKLATRLPALLVADSAAARAIARDPRLISVRADAVQEFRRRLAHSVTLASKAQVPLREGVAAWFHVFRDAGGGSPVAVVIGEPDFQKPVPVRLHSACLTGDVFGSRRCDCGAQLQLAITRLAESGGGVILYLEQEGRGLGLANKMRAYALQDAGLDTVDANTALGFEDDERDYAIAARMLRIIGCNRVLLMTNNPGKLEALNAAGVEVVGRMPLQAPINPDNRRYLAAKAAKAGHWLDGAFVEAEDEADALQPTSEP